MISVFAAVMIGIGALVVGLLVGFFVSRKVIMNHFKKNPPVNEKMIRVMMTQMGRTPSEKQVRQVVASMNNAK